MSLRKKKFPTFNRMEEKEETFYWLDLFDNENYYNWNDWDEYGWGVEWWHYPGGGYVDNMDQYHQMHLLTLLRSLDIRSARSEANNRGW